MSSKLPLRYWKTPRYRRLRKRFDREMRSFCKKHENRTGYQAACWNWYSKKNKAKLLREYKKGL